MTANGIFQLILYMVVLLALVKPLGTYMARVYECPTGLDRALVELIDLPPDDLLQRFKDGKVYIPGLAQEAVENFFRKGNLIALRELALQRTAQRVDAQMRVYMRDHAITRTWPVRERLLVCIGPSPFSVRLIRAAKQMAERLNAE